MYAQSLSFSLAKSFDTKGLAKKVPELKPGPGGRFLQANIGKLLVLFLPSGKTRITFPGENLDALHREIAANAVGLGRVLEAVRVAVGSDSDVGQALAAQSKDLVEFDEINVIPFADVRPTYQEKVSATLVDALLLGASQVLAEFQTDRFLSQAGEIMGRTVVRGAHITDAQGLLKLLLTELEEKSLGTGRFEAGPEGIDYLLTIEECFCAGSPVYGRPLCAVIRGMVRGAFTAFRRAENTSVHENQCWGLGHSQCQFEIRTLTV